MANVKVPPFTEAPSTVVGGTATSVFPFEFPFWAAADILVYVDDVLLDAADYSVEGFAIQDEEAVEGGYGSGEVTLDTAVTSCTVTIDRLVVGDRQTQFSRSVPLGMPALNGDLNRLTARQQDLRRRQAALEALGLDATQIAADAAQAGADRLAAEVAQALAEGARDLAQQYASDAATVSGVNVPIYASVASSEGSTIAAAVKSIRTQFREPTYADLSTLVGGAEYARVSLADITSGSYPAASYFRSTDRYMPDGTTDATNGGYWLLNEKIISPAMMGAKPNGTSYTSAWQAALDFGRPVRVPAGSWKFGPLTPPADADIEFVREATVVPDFATAGQEKLFNLTNPRVRLKGLKITSLTGTISEVKFLIFVAAADCYISDVSFAGVTMSDGNSGLTNLKIVHGIYLNTGADRCVVKRYRVNVLSGCAFFTKGSDAFTLDTFWITDTRWYSVNIDYDCAGFTIRNGVIDGDDVYTRYWGGSINLMSQTTGDPNRRALVDNIYIKGVHNYGAALRLLSCSDLNVTNIWLDDCIYGTLLADTVQYLTIDRRGVNTALPNGGPMNRVTIRGIKMRAKGQCQAIYMKNQHLTARDPHTDILIDDVVLYSPNSTDFFENALWINGYSGGFKTLTVTNLRGTVKTIAGSVQGGAIGVAAADNEGRISDLKIDAQLRDIGTIDHTLSHQMGYYLTNYINRASVTGSFENFRYGGRTGSTGLTGLRDLYDCQYVNCLDPLLLSTLPENAAKPLSRTTLPTSGILYAGQQILNPSAAPSASMGWQVTTSGPAADGAWLTATAYAAGIWKRNASSRVYELITAGGGNTSVEPTGTTVGATETGADGYVWKCRGALHQRLCTLPALSAVIAVP